MSRLHTDDQLACALEQMKFDRHTLRGRKVAILAADGFEYVELVVPKKALERAGARTEIVSLHGGKIRGMNISEPTRAVKVDSTLEQANPDQYDALLIPGGFIGPDFIRQSLKARRFVRAFDIASKPIATLGHGPWLLVSAELVGGRTLASWPGVRDDIVHAGGIWRDEPAVIDRNWVSSRGPADLDAFIHAMIDLFASGERRPIPGVVEAPAPAPAVSSPPYDEPLSFGGIVRRYLSMPEIWTVLGVLAVLGIGAFSIRRSGRRARRRRSIRL